MNVKKDGKKTAIMPSDYKRKNEQNQNYFDRNSKYRENVVSVAEKLNVPVVESYKYLGMSVNDGGNARVALKII